MAIIKSDIGYVPLTDAAGVVKVFDKQTHLGLDIGWYKNEHCSVLAWQDGTVVDKGYSSEVGYFVVLEHRYTTTKRWTGYIHLAALNNLPNGAKIEGGRPIGNAKRGDTGISRGTHLHLYLTQEAPISTVYTWNTMRSLAIDPFPFLYWDKSVNTEYISPSWPNKYPAIKYPEPVERNEEVEQCDIKSSTRRLRKGPGLKFESYPEYAKPGIYNVHGWTQADGYDWTRIDTIDGNEFFTAVMEGEDLPVADFKELYKEEKKLNEELTEKLNTAQTGLKRATEALEKIKTIVNEEAKQ